MGVVWYVIWLLFVSNEPSTDRFITSAEKNYLENCVPNIINTVSILSNDYRNLFLKIFFYYKHNFYQSIFVSSHAASLVILGRKFSNPNQCGLFSMNFSVFPG